MMDMKRREEKMSLVFLLDQIIFFLITSKVCNPNIDILLFDFDSCIKVFSHNRNMIIVFIVRNESALRGPGGVN